MELNSENNLNSFYGVMANGPLLVSLVLTGCPIFLALCLNIKNNKKPNFIPLKLMYKSE